MPKIGESLEQKRNAVTQGLNRIIYLINMLQKDNFKRLIKINLFAVDFWARKIIRLLSSLTVNRKKSRPYILITKNDDSEIRFLS